MRNVGKYFYKYVLGYRYDYEVINYFSDPYRNAIQSLFHEGYEVKEEYKRLFKDYKSRYSPLNLEEITYFFSEHLEVKDPLSELKIKEKLKSVKNIINSNLSIILIQSKNCGLEAKYKTQIKMLSIRSEILSK